MVGVPNHLNWITFSRNSSSNIDSSRVITYINNRLSYLHFSLRKDILNYKDISCVSFSNHGSVYFLINVYSDLLQSALKYLKDTEANTNNVLIMMGDFNIRDCYHSWDPNYSFHSYKNTLFDITDTFYLELSIPTNCIPTRYSDNQWDLDLVIDLIFFKPYSLEHNNYSIHLTSDYTSLSIDIAIFDENIQTKKYTIIKDSEEENNFINKLIKAIKSLNMNNIYNKDNFKHIIQTFTGCIERILFKHSKIVNITKHSKAWWDKNYCRSLEKYRQFKRLEDWKVFKSIVKKTKHKFFNLKIQEITNKSCKP